MRRLKLSRTQIAIICLLGAAIVAALIVLIVMADASANRQQTVIRGDFTPPPFESAAITGVPEVDEELGWSELAIRDGYVVHLCGVLNANVDGIVPVWLSSDSSNDVWVKLRLRNSEGELLGETGILKPGEYVENLKITAIEALPGKGESADVILQVMGYEPDTYYSAGSVGLATTLSLTD